MPQYRNLISNLRSNPSSGNDLRCRMVVTQDRILIPRIECVIWRVDSVLAVEPVFVQSEARRHGGLAVSQGFEANDHVSCLVCVCRF